MYCRLDMHVVEMTLTSHVHFICVHITVHFSFFPARFLMFCFGTPCSYCLFDLNCVYPFIFWFCFFSQLPFCCDLGLFHYTFWVIWIHNHILLKIPYCSRVSVLTMNVQFEYQGFLITAGDKKVHNIQVKLYSKECLRLGHFLVSVIFKISMWKHHLQPTGYPHGLVHILVNFSHIFCFVTRIYHFKVNPWLICDSVTDPEGNNPIIFFCPFTYIHWFQPRHSF